MSGQRLQKAGQRIEWSTKYARLVSLWLRWEANSIVPAEVMRSRFTRLGVPIPASTIAATAKNSTGEADKLLIPVVVRNRGASYEQQHVDRQSWSLLIEVD